MYLHHTISSPRDAFTVLPWDFLQFKDVLEATTDLIPAKERLLERFWDEKINAFLHPDQGLSTPDSPG